MAKKNNSTDCTNVIYKEEFVSKKIDTNFNTTYKNVIFKEARIKAVDIDYSNKMGNVISETLVMRLLDGEHRIVVKISKTRSSIRFQTKNFEDLNYTDEYLYLDSMIDGVFLAEELQSHFNKRWVKDFRKHLIANEPSYDPNITNKELFQILVSSRASES